MEDIRLTDWHASFKFLISIIIVSYNTSDLLSACLESVEKELVNSGFTGQAEIFVVDNNFKDGSGDMVKVEFPEVCLIQNRNNLGFGKANNRAIEWAKGKYLFFLNPDTEVCRDAIGIMVDFMEKSRRRIRKIQSLQAIWLIFSLHFELLFFPSNPILWQKFLEYRTILSLYKSL